MPTKPKRKRDNGIPKDQLTDAEQASLKFLTKLDVQNTPDALNRRNRFAQRTHGKKHGLGIRHYWAHLFRANEGLPQYRHMTDEEIKRQMQLEYPKRKSVIKLGRPHEAGDVTVNYYRTLYNKGLLCRDNFPSRASFRYNSVGEKVEPRVGRQRLTPEEIATHKAWVKATHDRLEKAAVDEMRVYKEGKMEDTLD